MQDDTTELWRPILGFENYEVSSHGRIRSLPRRCVPKLHMMRPLAMPDGHLRVTLSRDSRPHYVLVHRAVMWAFVGPQPKGIDVRHLDGDPANNLLSNLCYGTRSENLHDMVKHGGHYYAKRTECPKCGGPYEWQESQGCRFCRRCYNERSKVWRREYRLKRKAAGNPVYVPVAERERRAEV